MLPERMREYRARKKFAFNQLAFNQKHAFVGLPCQDINATCKRTPAEHMRDYRTRKKIYLQSTSDSSSVVHHQDDEILLADDNLNTVVPRHTSLIRSATLLVS
ncbi:hypothetical protein TNCT_460441 [Trichonephila clavata]|uniref:Uncharacterized protein n=1 Tax=Trichonephila clavata TaxID=2740835 RepID=A0A8X6JA68_TRICU|nr:hypothetical protein TNCT_460441 [Trichonephila clavata]